jgi:uncharacterized alkaline shock family protein YloU
VSTTQQGEAYGDPDGDPYGDPHGDPDPEAEPAHDNPPELRGTLRIAPRVVERIAGAAASEIHGVGGRRRDGQPGVRVAASMHGSAARLRIGLPIAYPLPIRATVAQVRRHVSERIQALTDVTLSQVDVEVTEFTAPARPRRRVM